MSIWSKLLGLDPPPAAEIPIGEASGRDRTQAEFHRDRFARAIVQCQEAVQRGEKTPERMAELQRYHAYYAGLAKLEAGLAPAPVEEGGA
jgi:hypothetical protein